MNAVDALSNLESNNTLALALVVILLLSACSVTKDCDTQVPQYSYLHSSKSMRPACRRIMTLMRTPPPSLVWAWDA
jgi:hypothetical protein